MSTSKVDNIYLLTFGYIRELETNYSFKYQLPQQITKLIFNYHPRDFKFKKCNMLKEIKWDIKNDGLTVTSRSDVFVSVQFGDFFTKQTNCIYTVKFLMKTAKSGFSGIGFITNEFDDIEHRTFNKGNNNSMIAYGNGYYATSPCFNKAMTDHCTFPFGYDNFYQKGDEMIVQIDTLKKTATIWNYTELKVDDVKLLNTNNDELMRRYKLPLEKHDIAIIIEFGVYDQTVTATEQTFVFHKK